MSIAEHDAPVRSGYSHLYLPCTDGKPVENNYQTYQTALLISLLTPVLERRYPGGNYYAAADNGIYWKRTEEPLQGCRAPDWYYVPNVTRLLDGEIRRSYVLWEELIPPVVLIEFVSGDGSEERDSTPNSGKFWVYEQAIRGKHYLIWDPFRVQLEVHELIEDRYHQRTADAHGRYLIPELGVEFGIWNGVYQGITADWLRIWDNGQLVATPEELNEIERQATERQRRRADSEKRRAEHEKQRADRLAARLRELGLDPESV